MRISEMSLPSSSRRASTTSSNLTREQQEINPGRLSNAPLDVLQTTGPGEVHPGSRVVPHHAPNRHRPLDVGQGSTTRILQGSSRPRIPHPQPSTAPTALANNNHPVSASIYSPRRYQGPGSSFKPGEHHHTLIAFVAACPSLIRLAPGPEGVLCIFPLQTTPRASTASTSGPLEQSPALCCQL